MSGEDTVTPANPLCRTITLDDNPVEQDEFGSHASVSNAIANLIAKEEGGRSIALTGIWGSGKSSVVQILRSKLEGNSKEYSTDNLVFVFDAWCHQGDPLRRSFLEQLICFLMEADWISKKNEWKQKKEELSGRRSKTKTTQTSELRLAGLIFAISGLLIPIGAALVSLGIALSDYRSWLRLGFPLLALPFLIFFAAMLFAVIAKGKISLALNFISRDSKTDVVSETAETADPTSIEFRKLFISLMDEVLDRPRRRLLIVIDNLDRVETKDAKEIWATMRTFFERDVHLRLASHLNHLWLLVPFAYESMLGLWKDGDKHDFADSFLEKTFQIVFRVPPPAFSDWREYFGRQLSEAFPDHKKSELETIPILYSMSRFNKAKDVTPRGIKLFINKVGSLHRQWDDTIPLQVQALYELCRAEITQDGSQILANPGFLGAEQSRIEHLVSTSTDLCKYLAALHFSVEPDRALHILLSSRIEGALENGDSAELDKMKEINGFGVVVEDIIESRYEQWSGQEPAKLGLSARALDDLNLDEELLPSRVWAYLLRGLSLMTELKPVNTSVSSGFITLLGYSTPQELQEKTATLIASIDLNGFSLAKEQGNQVFQECIGGLRIVLEGAQRLGQSETIKQNLRIPSGELYLDIIEALGEANVANDILSYFGLAPNQKDETMERLVELVSTGELSSKHATAVRQMILISSDWLWDSFIEAMSARLQFSAEQLNTSARNACLRALATLAYEANVSLAIARVQELAAQGSLAHQLFAANNDGDQEAIALCVLPMLDAVPQGDVPDSGGLISAGTNLFRSITSNPHDKPDTVKALEDMVIEYKRVAWLLEMPMNVATEPLITSVAVSIANRPDALLEFPMEAVMLNTERLLGLLGEESTSAIIIGLVQQTDFLKESIMRGFNPDRAFTYLLSLNSDVAVKDDDFANFLADGLREVDEQIWLQELCNEGQLVRLLMRLIEAGIKIELALPFQNALNEHGRQVLNGETIPQNLSDSWVLLVEGMPSHLRTTFLNNLLDTLMSEGMRPIEPILGLYGEALLSMKPAASKADEAVRRIFLEIVKRHNEPELVWLDKALQSDSYWINATEATQKTFQDQVRMTQQVLGPDDENSEILKSIASRIGLDLAGGNGESED